MGCFSGPDVPGPTPEEIKLQKMQIEQLENQNRLQEQFQPFILESLGFKIEDDGSVTRLEEEPDEIAQLLEERTLKALKGELDVSPALERQFSEQRSALEENLSRRLGEDYETTTAGLQSLGEFDQRTNALREDLRSGQISTGEGLLQSRLGFLQGQEQVGLTNLSAFAAPVSSGAFQSALQPFQFDRNMQFQANVAGAQNRAGMISGLTGAAGTGVGVWAGLQ